MDEIWKLNHKSKIAKSILRLDEQLITVGLNNKWVDYYHVFFMGLMGSGKILSPYKFVKRH